MTSKKLIILFITILSFIVTPSSARSDEFKLVPSVTALEEYNSNIFFTSYKPESDYVTTLSPAFELVNRTERSNANVKILLDLIGYADNRDLNAADQSYQGKLRYKITPRFGISADAGYISDSRPDRDLETTGLVSSAIRRDRITAGQTTDYQLSEETALSLSYAYGKETYEKEYSDILTHDINAGIIRDLTKYVAALKGYINLGYSHFDISDNQFDNQMGIISGTVGVSKDFNELWNASIFGGMRYTQSDFSALRLEQVAPNFFQFVTDEQTDNGWGWVGKASLNYQGEKSSGEFAFVRDVRPSSGYNTAAVRNALTLNTRYKITYEMSASLNTGYFTNKSDRFEISGDSIDTNSFYASPSIHYEVTKDISIDASYRCNIFNDNTADTEADRHLFSIRLYIQHPLLE